MHCLYHLKFYPKIESGYSLIITQAEASNNSKNKHAQITYANQAHMIKISVPALRSYYFLNNQDIFKAIAKSFLEHVKEGYGVVP